MLRLIMGAIAFSSLMFTERMLSRWAFCNSLAARLAHYKTVSGALGVAGQIAFAAFPVIHLRRRSDWLIPLANNPTHSARAATDALPTWH